MQKVPKLKPQMHVLKRTVALEGKRLSQVNMTEQFLLKYLGKQYPCTERVDGNVIGEEILLGFLCQIQKACSFATYSEKCWIQ